MRPHCKGSSWLILLPITFGRQGQLVSEEKCLGVCMCVCVCEWVCMCVSVCVCVCVHACVHLGMHVYGFIFSASAVDFLWYFTCLCIAHITGERNWRNIETIICWCSEASLLCTCSCWDETSVGMIWCDYIFTTRLPWFWFDIRK